MKARRPQFGKSLRSEDSLRYVLGLGSIAFSLWTMWRPSQVAGIMASDEETVQALGVRDFGCGLELLIGQNPRSAIVSRIVFDLSDMAMLAKKRPFASAFAAGSAALGVVAFVTSE